MPIVQLDPNARTLALAEAAAMLAHEAAALGRALAEERGGRVNPAAERALAQAEEAAALVHELESEKKWADALHAATWAITASAVALSVARDAAAEAGAIVRLASNA